MNVASLIVIFALTIGLCGAQQDSTESWYYTTGSLCSSDITSCSYTYQISAMGLPNLQEYYYCVQGARCYTSYDQNMREQQMQYINEQINYYHQNGGGGASSIGLSLVVATGSLLAALKAIRG